jgi:hypothetical protein
MVLLADVGEIEPCFGPFGDSLISTQDRCMVCAECTTAMEIILGTPNGTPSYVGQVDSCFGLFGESVFLGAR